VVREERSQVAEKEDVMTSKRFGVAGLAAAALIFATTAPAVAQPAEERGFVTGTGGAAISVVNAGTFGASAGVKVAPNLLITGNVGRMQDVFANFTRDDMRTAEEQMLNEEGISLDLRVKMPTMYFTGGVRALLPAMGVVRPYFAGGGGIARLKPAPVFLVEGLDLTSVMLEDPELAPAFKKTNRPIANVGGGLTVTVVPHFVVDIGYEYSRIFIKETYLQSTDSPHQHDGINVNRVYVGLGYAF
jgi:hypothetical protein